MNFISKINKYLIERYPIIWNTRLVWMLLIIAFLHLVSYLAGLIVTIPILQNGSPSDALYFNGVFQIQLLIALMALIFWVTAYFKNNPLSKLYPLSHIGMIKQFAIHFVILLGLLSFYIPYEYSLNRTISRKFNIEQISKDAHLVNKAMAFIPREKNHYNINQRVYPSIYNTLNFNLNNRTASRRFSHPVLKEEKVSYHELTAEAKKKYEGILNIPLDTYTIEEAEDSTYYVECFITYNIDDLNTDLGITINTHSSFLNYSSLFFVNTLYQKYPELLKELAGDEDDLEIISKFESQDYFNSYPAAKEALRYPLPYSMPLNKWVINFVERDSEVEFNALMSELLIVLDRYQIEHNLNLNKLRQIYNNNLSEVSEYMTPNNNGQPNFLFSTRLHNVFDNYYDAYEYNPRQNIELFPFLFAALILSFLLLLFKCYNFKSILLSIAAYTLSSIIISLFSLMVDIPFILLIILGGYIVNGWINYKNVNKNILGMFQIISLSSFPFFLVMLWEKLNFDGDFWPEALLPLWAAYILVFLLQIRKWRALPER